MKLQAIAHATMALWGDDDQPILITDPWLVGSCYWRSWWLQHPPLGSEIDKLAAAPFIYITHEHPDHLHPPSLRRLGSGAEILLPDFLEMKMDKHLSHMGYAVRRLPAARWVALSPGISVLSLPNWANDSILLVDTPQALVINLNDAKPSRKLLRTIGNMRRRLDKPAVALRSYSPASPFNNYFRRGKRRVGGPKENYVRAASEACDAVGATWFIPFASQVVFRRSDSRWANRFAVRYPDLKALWGAHATLLPPFTTLDLKSYETTSADPESYRGHFTRPRKLLVHEAQERDAAAVLDAEDFDRLLENLARVRFYLKWAFAKGIGFRLGQRRFRYDPLKHEIEHGGEDGAFVLEAPPAAFKDALAVGHFGDLSIPMFTNIHLSRRMPRRRVNRFFMLLILCDYGYGGGFGRWLRWLRWAWKCERHATIVPPPSAD